MKKILLFILPSFFFCICIQAQDRPGIKLINNDSAYDFGLIDAGGNGIGALTHQFEIKNDGNADLVITDVKSIDSNLKIEWTKKAVKPHKKILISVTYTLKDPSGTGSFSSDVLITSNATQRPYPFIHVTGGVIHIKQTAVSPQQQNNFPIEPGYERYNGDAVVK